MFSPQISSHRPNMHTCLVKISIGGNVEEQFVFFRLIGRAVVIGNVVIAPRTQSKRLAIY